MAPDASTAPPTSTRISNRYLRNSRPRSARREGSVGATGMEGDATSIPSATPSFAGNGGLAVIQWSSWLHGPFEHLGVTIRIGIRNEVGVSQLEPDLTAVGQCHSRGPHGGTKTSRLIDRPLTTDDRLHIRERIKGSISPAPSLDRAGREINDLDRASGCGQTNE